MKTITKLIMTLAVLVAAEVLCGGGLLQPVKAQTGDGSVRFVSYASIGSPRTEGSTQWGQQ